MAEYLGVNDAGLAVWQIEEGNQRPMVDKWGRITCERPNCQENHEPTRIHLGMASGEAVEWALLACPACWSAHCVMRVRRLGRWNAIHGNFEVPIWGRGEESGGDK